MIITKVSYERLELPLTVPYTIAYETVAHTTNFIIKIETTSHLVGYGCAAPDITVTEETIEEVEKDINNVIIPFLKGKNPFHLIRILDGLSPLLVKKSSALAMVDMALQDLMARKAGLPLYQLLGGFRSKIATSITIGILPLKETLEAANIYVNQGFFLLKIKGGLSVQEDIEKMIRLQEAYPKVKFRFDGNQGYSVEDAILFCLKTKDVPIEIFEQPTLVGNGEKIGKVSQKVAFPVMGDESIKSLKDAYHLVHNRFVDMINIKLMKVGGIIEGNHINSVAQAAGLETMIGCLDECRLGISAGLHFALSRPTVHFADLDGHLDIENDPFQGIFRLEKGVLYPTDAPGLGKIKL